MRIELFLPLDEKDKKNKNPMYIEVDNDKNKIGKGYFKVFNNSIRSKADKMCRISICDPEYIYHNNEDGRAEFELNSEYRRKLMRILSADNEKVWKEIVEKVLDKHTIKKKPKESYTIPDYTKLSYNKSDSKVGRN